MLGEVSKLGEASKLGETLPRWNRWISHTQAD
jgi:hypothetical protein